MKMKLRKSFRKHVRKTKVFPGGLIVRPNSQMLSLWRPSFDSWSGNQHVCHAMWPKYKKKKKKERKKRQKKNRKQGRKEKIIWRAVQEVSLANKSTTNKEQ